MAEINFDVTKSLDRGKRLYNPYESNRDLAYFTNNTPNDYNDLYGFFDWASDAKSAFYRMVQKGEMSENSDKMLVSKQNIDDLQELKESLDFILNSNDDTDQNEVAEAQNVYNAARERLRKNGVIGRDEDITGEQADELTAKNLDDYNDSMQNYYNDLDQYNSSMRAHDISQYYTRRSNEQVMGFNNWYFKMPATMGTSNTSPALQTESMLAGFAGAKAGAAAGAAIGSAGGPVGTAIGSVIGGGLGSLGFAQVFGGAQSRENESHMEAVEAYKQKVRDLMVNDNDELTKVLGNVKQQLTQKGVDTEFMDDDMLLEQALFNRDIVTGSNQFDDVAKQAYTGTRRVYEENNALGAGEAVSDLLRVVGVNKILKPIGKLGANLTRRFRTGVQLSKLGSTLRNKAVLEAAGAIIGSQLLHGTIEASEEGSQGMIVDDYLNGLFDDDYAHDNFWDAAFSGQVVSDIADTVWKRTKSIGAALNLNAEYKNDQQLMEEMLSGFLLQYGSPQAAASTAVRLATGNNVINKILKSKKVGDYLAGALIEKDEIARTEALLNNIQSGLGSSSNYEEILESARRELKSKDKNGKLRYGLDSTVLTADGSVPSDKDIDDYIDDQISEYSAVKRSQKKINSNIAKGKYSFKTPEDKNLYTALYHQTMRNSSESQAKTAAGDLANSISTGFLIDKLNNDNSEESKRLKKMMSDNGLTPADVYNALLLRRLEYLQMLNQQRANANKQLIDQDLLPQEANESVADSEVSIQKAIDDVKTKLQKTNQKDLDDFLNLFEEATTNLGDENKKSVGSYQQNVMKAAQLHMIMEGYKIKKQSFENDNTQSASEKINAARAARKSENKLADEANAAAREGRSPEVNIEQVKAENKKKKQAVTTLSDEQLVQDQTASTEQFNQDLSRIDSILNSVQQTSPLYELVKEINKAKSLTQGDSKAYARYLRNVISRVRDNYKNKTTDDKYSEDDKKILDQIIEATGSLSSALDLMLATDAEMSARKERRNPALANDSSIYTDDDGNRYIVHNEEAWYDDNNLVLVLENINDNQTQESKDRIKALEKAIKDSEAGLEKLKKDGASDESIAWAERSIATRKDLLNQLKEINRNKRLEVRSDDELLQKLYYTNNKGEKKYLSTKLKRYENSVSNLREADKQKRQKHQNEAYAEGDVEAFTKHKDDAPESHKDTQERNSRKRLLPKAYALATSFGLKQVAKLLNPYFQSRYWHGSISMPYANSKQAEKYFKKENRDNGIIEVHGVKVNRYKAIDLFHEIGKQVIKLRNKNLFDNDNFFNPIKDLISGKQKKVKIGNLEVTKSDFDNMIYGLPMIASMYQPRTGGQATIVHLSDYASANRKEKYSTDEYNTQANLISNLLMSYSEVSGETALEDMEGLTSENLEKSTSNRVYFESGSVKLIYTDFDYNVVTERNRESNIFQNENGQPMTSKEIDDFYESKLPYVIDAVNNNKAELVNILNSFGYDVTEESLNKEIDGKIALNELAKAIIKYGDGVIDVHNTFMKNVVQKFIGGRKHQGEKVADTDVRAAKALLDYMQSVAPEAFLSYGDSQAKYNNTPLVSESVSIALRNHWFDSEDSITILDGGERVNLTASEENEDALIKMFQFFENTLTSSKNSKEFMQTLRDYGYTFKIHGNEQRANQVLIDYYNNRHFNRLEVPSNIVQAISMGKATPLNSSVNYESFDRIERHQQGRLDQVKALGLKKNSGGVYYYSLEEWAQRNATTERSSEGLQSEFDNLYKEQEDNWNAYAEELRKIRSASALINFIQSHRVLFDDQQYNQLVKTNKAGETVLRSKFGIAKITLSGLLTNLKETSLSELENKYREQITKQLKAEDEFAGFSTLPITFAYGSFRNEDTGSQIIYFDSRGNKRTLTGSRGTPGAMYIVLPSFMTSAHRQQAVRLNPKRIDETTARVITTILQKLANGEVKEDEFVNELKVDGQFTLKSSGTYKDVLDALVFTGNDAIINNPTEVNYQRQLYVDTKGGDIIFGGRSLNNSTIDDLVNFIMENKTFRVDRKKAVDSGATFGIDLSIEDASGNSVMNANSADNYVAFIIDNGILTTDLSQNSNSRLVTGPRVYIDYKMKYQFAEPQNDETVEGTATNARKKLADDLGEEMNVEEFQDELANQQSEQDTSDEDAVDPAKYTTKFVRGFLKKASTVMQDAKVGQKLTVAVYGYNSKKIIKRFDAVVTQDEEGNKAVQLEDNGAFTKYMMGKVYKKKNVGLVLIDSDGNFVKLSDKQTFYGSGFTKLVIAGQQSKSSGTAVAPALSNIGDIIAQTVSATVAAVTQQLGMQQGNTQTSSEVLPQNVPAGEPVRTSGYTSLAGLGQRTNQEQRNAPVMEEEPQAASSATETANGSKLELSLDGNQFVVNRGDDLDSTLDRLSELAEIGVSEDELEAAEEKITDFLSQPAETNTPSQTTTAWGNTGNAAQVAVSNMSNKGDEQSTQNKQITSTPQNQTPQIPSFSKLYDDLRQNDKNQIENLKRSLRSKDVKDVDNALQAAIASYLSRNYKIGPMDAIRMLRTPENSKVLREMGVNLRSGKNNLYTGSIVDFFNNFVEKEDFTPALQRAEKILGKDFDLSFLPESHRVWDSNRQAMIYVFGQCAAAGIRLFRDSNNRIAKGSLYHEAFHKISLFVLSKEDRQKMYQQAMLTYDEINEDWTDKQIEEYLADRFAEFVSDSEMRHKGKYYTGNFISRVFQRLFDKINTIIRQLTGKGLTPKYTDMNKLFKDMYSGRYAYAKATKDNLEEFNALYEGNIPYTGFKVNGVEIADNAVQYDEIFRDLLGRFIRTTDLLTTTSGTISVNTDRILEQLQSEIRIYAAAAERINRHLSLSKTDPILASMSNDAVYTAAVQIANVLDVYRKIVEPTNWAQWSNILKDSVERRFNLVQQDSNDANDIVNTDLIENEDGEFVVNTEQQTLSISNQRDSYMTDMFKSMDVSMKMLLWGITQSNPNDPSSNKFTANGLIKYADANELYREAIAAVAGAENVQDMLDKLEIAAEKAIQDRGDYSLMQLFNILNNPATSQAIRNRFFTDFVRYTHKFENHSYESTDHKVGEKTISSYKASVRSGNTDTVSDTIQSKWKRNMKYAISRIADTLNNTEKGKRLATFKKMKEPLVEAIRKASITNLSSLENLLIEANKLYGIGDITGDSRKDAITLQTALKDAKGLMLFKNILNVLNTQQTASFLSKDNEDSAVMKLLNTQFKNVKSPIVTFMNLLSSSQKPTAKTTSQKGPGNTKIYSIGAYNFITRMFDTVMRTKEWLNKVADNAYAQHSKWLGKLMATAGVNNIEFRTKLGTILNDSYDDSVADIEISEVEDTLNRFVSTLSGFNQIPSLANKRFAGDVANMFNFTNVVDSNGVLSKEVIDTFVGYLADEILAISDAIYLRNEFINRLNNVTGGKYTIESFSKLSSLEQEELFRNNKEAAKLLKMLVKQYHYKDGSPQFLKDEKNDRIVRRAFHIDLRKGTGYNFRHFKSLNGKLTLSQSIVDKMSKNSLTENSRKEDAQIALNIAKGATDTVVKMLQSNIALSVNHMINLGIIGGFQADPKTGSVDINSLNNVYLPTNIVGETSDGKAIYKAIATYTIQGMSDMAEFEKLISGDIGYHKDITSVNKRYSGIVSTYQITSEKGTVRNELMEDDRLYDSPTYNTVALGTSLVVNKTKLIGDSISTLGVNIITDFVENDGSVETVVDHKLLLDENGKLLKHVADKPLIIRHKVYAETHGLTLTDEQIAQRASEDFKRRFEGYLNIDPTDAAVLISSQMFRALKQREGKWNDRDEAAWTILENFDNIYALSRDKNKSQILLKYCNTLGIDYNELVSKAKDYQQAVIRKDTKAIRNYKGYILGATAGVDFTSLKYVYYGEDQGREDKLITPIYDKMSLIPVLKILSDEHQMAEVYSYMNDNQADLLKYDSATKSGGVPSFEMFDENGNINRRSLNNSPVQQQFFTKLGKQLNTDPHHTTQASLLTQFMKIAVMNVQDDEIVNVNGTEIKGSAFRQLYKAIISELTDRGAKAFNARFGITEDGVDKIKFMQKIHEMFSREDIPYDTLSAFDTDEQGEFLIHPSAIPNIRVLESKILSEMGKVIIDTTTPGQPLYQAPSVGFDNIFNLKTHTDKHLLMPGEIGDDGKVNDKMQIRLSINFFADVIKEAKKKGVGGYDFDNFEDQKRFILDNKDLFALAYRVPTQGQNSTMPVEIVDIMPSQAGAVIHMPAGLTALTGSDFDIDKLFLSRYNYTVKNGKVQKVGYSATKVLMNPSAYSDAQLQNALIDMYLGVLTSPNHYLAANTPLDVCTDPLKRYAKKVMAMNEVSEEEYDGYYLNPVFQTKQKMKNAGSDGGIGPMALNSVFRALVQQSNLMLEANKYLEELGLSNLNQVYDRYGEDILDATSALINAHVDAVKDNYIGAVNVNGFTFDMVSLLITAGFGNDTFALLSQPILMQVANNWKNWKNGTIGVNSELSRGNVFMDSVREDYMDQLTSEQKRSGRFAELASPEELTKEFMYKQLENPNPEIQLRYLNTFNYLKQIAQEYRNAVNAVQIDTKKYGISANEIITFMQNVNHFISEYNITFQNPEALFDDTFIGDKYQNSLVSLFDSLGTTIFEFSNLYKGIADTLCKNYGKEGVYGKKFLRRVGPKIKAAVFTQFFNTYLAERYPNSSKPLYELTTGKDSVMARFERIKNKCYINGEGASLFDMVRYSSIGEARVPQFMLVDPAVKDNPAIKNNVQQAISELFDSSDPEIRQWAQDLAVYMFYLTGGSDGNAGGLLRTTLYDLFPPQRIASITAGGETFNQFVTRVMSSSQSSVADQSLLDHIILLAGISDDEVVPKLSRRLHTVVKLEGDDIITIRKGSNYLKNNDGEYSRFIKQVDKNGNQQLYVLGGIAYSSPKTGKYAGSYFDNPIYFKVQTIGYRNSKQPSMSVRTDGSIAEDGSIKSLLWSNSVPKYKSIQQVRDSDQKLYDRIINSLGRGNFVAFASADVNKDYSEYLDNNTLPEYLSNAQVAKALIDASNQVFYLRTDNGTQQEAVANNVGYSEHKQKPFEKVNTNTTSDFNGTATIVNVSSNPNEAIQFMTNNPQIQFLVLADDFGREFIGEIPGNVTLITQNRQDSSLSNDEKIGKQIKDDCNS